MSARFHKSPVGILFGIEIHSKSQTLQLTRIHRLALLAGLLLIGDCLVPTVGQHTILENEHCLYPGVCSNSGSFLEQLLKDQQDLKHIVQRMKVDLAEHQQTISKLEADLSQAVQSCCSGQSSGGYDDLHALPTVPPGSPSLADIRAVLLTTYGRCTNSTGVVINSGIIYASCSENKQANTISVFDSEEDLQVYRQTSNTNKFLFNPPSTVEPKLATCHRTKELFAFENSRQTEGIPTIWRTNVSANVLVPNKPIWQQLSNPTDSIIHWISLSESCDEILTLAGNELQVHSRHNELIVSKVLPGEPRAIVKRGNYYIVASSSGGRSSVVLYDELWNELATYGSNRQRELQDLISIQDLALYKEGRVLVADASDGRVVLLEADLSASVVLLSGLPSLSLIDYDPVSQRLVVSGTTLSVYDLGRPIPSR